MKTAITGVISFVIILFVSCRKESDPVFSSHEPFYSKTLQVAGRSQYDLFAGCSKNNFLYIVQKEAGSSYFLTKCTGDLTIAYQRNIELGEEKLMRVVGSVKDDCFFTVSASDNIGDIPPETVSAFVYVGKKPGSASCNVSASDYSYYNSFNYKPEQKVVNRTILRKFNKAGDQVWKCEFEGNYYRGNPLSMDDEGNLVLLTANRAPYRPYMNKKLSGGLTPYYDFPTDSNSFTIQKINNNGNVIALKTMYNVIQTQFYSFEPSLSVSAKEIYVSNQNNLYVFDKYFRLVTDVKPLDNSCNNEIRTVVANPYTDTVFVSGGLLKEFLQYNNYTAQLKRHRLIKSSQNLNSEANFVLMDNEGYVYAVDKYGFSKLAKYSPGGEQIYNKSLYDHGFLVSFRWQSMMTDRSNKLIIVLLQSYRIQVYKLDEKGNFE